MEVVGLNALSDNYIWVADVRHEGVQRAFVVDPGESAQVIDYLECNDLTLDTILLTHQHDDHIGGVSALLSKYPNVHVIGPSEVSDLVTQVVSDGDQFDLVNKSVTVFKTAGHTEEHISFLIEGNLFCGDALFYGGCGRVFTGDYQASFDGLQKLKTLPKETKVYAGHEYTLTNLKFAKSVAFRPSVVARHLNFVDVVCRNNTPSLPSTIGIELDVNPFINASTVAEFKKLRDLRDQFKG